MKWILIFTAIFLLPQCALSSPLSARELYDTIVSKYNVETWSKAQSQFLQSRLAKETAWENPQVQFGVGTAKVGSFNGSYKEWIVSQSIPINGLRSSKREQLAVQKKQSVYEAQNITNTTHSEVIRMLFFHLYNIERARHIEERLSRLQLVDSYLKNKKFAAPKDLVEKAQITNRIKHLKIEVVHIQNDLQHSMTYFKNLAGIDGLASIHLSWPDPQKISQHFYQYVNTQQPFEDQMNLNAEVHQIELKAAKKQWIPDLKLYYMQTFQDQYLQEPNINEAFGVTVSVPVFNLGRNAVKEKQAAATIQQMERNKESIHRSSQILALKNKFQAAQLSLGEFNDRYIEKVDKELDKATAHFKNGLVPAANFLDLEDQVHESLHIVSRSKLEMIESTLEVITMNTITTDFRTLFL